jgi:hypothetical protein
MAREEVTSLLRQLKLPIDERGRRRAANRAEWFNQVNKPVEVHDIFGAPQIGFQTGDRLGRALSLNLLKAASSAGWFPDHQPAKCPNYPPRTLRASARIPLPRGCRLVIH